MTAQILEFPRAKIIRFPQPGDEQIRLARILERELQAIVDGEDRPCDTQGPDDGRAT